MEKNEINKVKLVDICSIITKGTTPKSGYISKIDLDAVTYIRAENIDKVIIGIESLKYIPKTVHENELKRSILQKNDILITIAGTLGRVAIMPESLLPANTNQAVGIVRINNPRAYLKYIYYSLLEPKLMEELISSSSGQSVQPNLNLQQVGNIEIFLPPLPIQKKIASILNVLDDKIEINKKINSNLEEEVVTIFNNFLTSGNVFDDEDFGSISTKFIKTKVGSISMIITDFVANGSFASLKENVSLLDKRDYAYFIRNTDLKSGRFDVYVNKHSYDFLSKSTLYGGEIIISNVGDVGSVFLCPKLDLPMTLGNNIIMLRPENDDLRLYLYIWFKHSFGKHMIKNITGGSAQPKFNKTDFKNTKIFVPIDSEIKVFNQMVKHIFDKITINLEENKKLAELRDSLLPKLLSGEIDVTNLDI